MEHDPHLTLEGTMRTKYYKAVSTELAGPVYSGGGQLYLPDTVHRSLVELDSSLSCVVGLYYTAHERVAARWGPVVVEVEVLGSQVRTDHTVKPGAVPYGVDVGSYRKYRTDELRIVRFVGITGYVDAYGRGSPERGFAAKLTARGDAGAREDAERKLERLNDTLARHGRPLLRLGALRQRLRTREGDSVQYLLFDLVEPVPVERQYTVTITTTVSLVSEQPDPHRA